MRVNTSRRLLRRPALSTQILLLQLTIIVVTVGIGIAVALLQARRALDNAAGRRSLVIAHTVAALPQIPQAFALRHPERVIDPIAERIRHATDASFVVVTNRAGIRYSHPDKSKIGQSLASVRGRGSH